MKHRKIRLQTHHEGFQDFEIDSNFQDPQFLGTIHNPPTFALQVLFIGQERGPSLSSIFNQFVYSN